MYCIAQSLVLPTLTEEERMALLKQAALKSVDEIFEAVPDPRGRHGLRYELAFLLTCLVAALLCNCNSTEAVANGVASMKPCCVRSLGLVCFCVRAAHCIGGCCPDWMPRPWSR